MLGPNVRTFSKLYKMKETVIMWVAQRLVTNIATIRKQKFFISLKVNQDMRLRKQSFYYNTEPYQIRNRNEKSNVANHYHHNNVGSKNGTSSARSTKRRVHKGIANCNVQQKFCLCLIQMKLSLAFLSLLLVAIYLY